MFLCEIDKFSWYHEKGMSYDLHVLDGGDFFRKFCDSDLTERFARDRLVFNVS